MKNKHKLMDIMIENKLTFKDVAKLLSITPMSVHCWIAQEDRTWHRNMPDNMIELLLLKLNKKPIL